MPELPLVMAGGALGAGARFMFGRMLGGRMLGAGAFPWSTLAVNLLGGLLMGLLAGAMARGTAGQSSWLFAGVGVLGGFTTFSAFSLDAVAMMERGDWAAALLYVSASVAGALALFAAGQAIAGAPR